MSPGVGAGTGASSLPVPKRNRSVLRYPAARLRAGDGVRDVFLLHLKETPSGFVCAEGISPVDTPFTETPLKLVVLPDEVFSLNYVPSRAWNAFYALFKRRSFYNYKADGFRCAMTVAMKTTEATDGYWYFVFDKEAVLFRADTGEIIDYSENTGGVCGLEYAGRIFVAQNGKIIYSPTYRLGNWKVRSNKAVQDSGTLFVEPLCGQFVGCIVYRESAYFFAQYGALKVQMGGKVLNTKTMLYPQNFGEVLPCSCCLVDGKVYFLTTKGLCRFDGSSFERVETPGARLIDFSAEAEVGSMDGKFYAHVALKDGNRRIYVYDPYFDRDSFLEMEVKSFGACHKGYVIHGGRICALTECGLPPDGDPCSLCMRLSLGSRCNPCTEWVCVEGEGEFTVQASTEEDGCAFAKGSAGRRLYLSRVLRGGEVALTISTFSENCRITGVSVGVGEDSQYDD